MLLDAAKLRDLLEQVQAGNVSTDSALEALRDLPFEDLGFAKSIIIALCARAFLK
jgi:hypothetical protein